MRTSPPGTGERGLTLIEVLISISILGIIIGVIGSALFIGLRTTDATTARLAESHDNQLLVSHLLADVQSVAPGGVDTSPGAAACSSAGTNVLQLSWTDAGDGTAFVAAYRRQLSADGARAELTRFFCTASGAPVAIVVASELDPAASPPNPLVTLNGNRVSLRLTEVSGYIYNVAATSRTPNPSTGVTSLATIANQVTASAGSSIGVTATLSGATTAPSATGTISYYFLGPSATPPATCPGAAAAVGSRTVTSNGAYPFSFTAPTTPGRYWWYASYTGDAANDPASGACGDVSDEVVLTNPTPPTFVVTVSTTTTATCLIPICAGTPFTLTIRATTDGTTTDNSYTGRRVITFTGPGDAPNGQSPQYPANVCFGGGGPCPGAPGNGTASVTLFRAEAVTLNLSDGSRSGTAAVTVRPAVPLSINCPNNLGNGASFTSFVSRAATDAWNNPDPRAAITATMTHTNNSSTLSPGSVPIAANQASSNPSQFTYTGAASGNYTDTVTATGPAGYIPAKCTPHVH